MGWNDRPTQGRPQTGYRGGSGTTPEKRPALAPVQYFDDKGNLRVALVDEEADEQAQQISEMAPSQVRRYYGEVLSIRRRLEHEAGSTQSESREEVFARLRAEFKMLKAKAFYAKERSPAVFPDAMRDFIERHTAAVKTVKDFEAFCKHFEAVVAFHKVYGRERG